MKIIGKQTVEIEIDEKELSYVLMEYVIDHYFAGDFDDGGLEWYTKYSKVYVGGEDWLVSENPLVATLVDSVNILRYGRKLELHSE